MSYNNLKNIKQINTPLLLEGNFPSGSINSLPSQTISSSPVGSMESTEIDIQIINKSIPKKTPKKKTKIKKNQPETNPPPTSTPSQPTNTGPAPETDYEGGANNATPLYKTRPSQFEINKYMYKRPNRMQEKDPAKKIGIFLHHTANHGRTDKGKKTCKSWNNNGNAKDGSWSSSSHSVIDENGHIEYVIPTNFTAYTQGVITEHTFRYSNATGKKQNKSGQKLKIPAANTYGIGCEIENFGFLTDKVNGKWQRNYKVKIGGKRVVAKDKNGDPKPEQGLRLSETDSRICKYVDFDLQPMRSFKGQKWGVELPEVQVKGVIKWVKETLKEMKIENWKFTQHTYNQMFPNVGWGDIKSKYKYLNGGKELPRKNVYIEHEGVAFLSTPQKSSYYAISLDWIKGIRGVYTHSSVQSTKTDITPTPNLIRALKENFGEGATNNQPSQPVANNNNKKAPLLFMHGLTTSRTADQQEKLLKAGYGIDRIVERFSYSDNGKDRLKDSLKSNPDSIVVLYSAGGKHALEIAKAMSSEQVKKLFVVQPWLGNTTRKNQALEAINTYKVPSYNYFFGTTSSVGKIAYPPVGLGGTKTPTTYDHFTSLTYAGGIIKKKYS